MDDVEVGLLARPDDPVREDVWVRAASLARDRVHTFDIVRAHPVQPIIHHRDDLVLTHAGLQRLVDILVDAVDHRRSRREQHDLVA